MTIPFTAPKPIFREVASLADIGAGSPAQLTNMPTGWLGYEAGADPYNNYQVGTYLLASGALPSTAGGLFVVCEDTLGNVIALLITDQSQYTTLGAKLAFVVAQTGTPQALTGTYATPQAAITAAVAARSGPTVPVDILVLPGSYAGFQLQPNVHVSGLDDDVSAVQITSAVSFLPAAPANSIAQLSNMTISTGANTAIDGTNAANYTLNIYNCNTDNSSAANPTINMAAGDGLNVESSLTSNAAGEAMSTAAPVNSTQSIWAASSATSAVIFAANVTVTMDRSEMRNGTNPTFSGAAGTLVVRGGLPGMVSAASTLTVTVDLSSGWLPLVQEANDTNLTVNGGTEQVIVTIVATNRVITLPPTSSQLPGKELLIVRVDNVGGNRCDVTPQAPDAIVPGPGAGNPIRLGPGDSVRLRARRGSNQWLRVP